MEKKSTKLKALCFAFLSILMISSCKKHEVIVEGGLKANHNNLASAGDGQNDLLGYGYDVTGEYANSSASKFSVIDIVQLKAAQPTRVEWDLSSKKYGEVIAGENALTYLQSLTSKLGANLSIKDESAGADAKIPFFKGSINSSGDYTNNFSSKFIYSSYALKIQQKRVKLNADINLMRQYLTQSFIDDVQNNTAQVIVSKYGTHVLTDIILGAKLDILYTSETSKSDVKTAATSGIEFNILGIFGINSSQTQTNQTIVEHTNQRLIFKAIGGEPSASLTGNIPLGSTLPQLSTTQWENSSSLLNAEMIDISEGGMVPLWDLIADANKSAAVKQYIIDYLLANKIKVAAAPIYQYYNTAAADHFYSKTLYNPSGYFLEGVAFNAFPHVGIPDAIPVHRYFNPSTGDHYYPTTAYNPSGYIYEGIEFYAYPTSKPNTSPVHVYYNPSTADHYYTKSQYNPSGFIYQGIAFYVPNN